jgi:thiamine biosynthesis lipoprotein
MTSVASGYGCNRGAATRVVAVHPVVEQSTLPGPNWPVMAGCLIARGRNSQPSRAVRLAGRQAANQPRCELGWRRVRHQLLCFFGLAWFVTLGGCGPSESLPPLLEISGETMGTYFRVQVVGQAAVDARAELQAAVDEELRRVNLQMSTYLPESEISRFGRFESTDWFEVSRETVEVIEAAGRISEQSGGAFDVTVGPLVDLWGFGPGVRPEAAPSQERLDEIMQYVGYQLLETRREPPALRKAHPRLQVDLSAIAKGHGIDRVSRLLSERGFGNSLVEIGGDVRASGRRPDGKAWRLGIEQPNVELGAAIQRIIRLSDQGLATSGDYRNFYRLDGERFSHTIDPSSGRPVQHRLTSVSVVAETCMLADGRATALLALGPERARQLAREQGWAVLLLERTDSGLEAFETAGMEPLWVKP